MAHPAPPRAMPKVAQSLRFLTLAAFLVFCDQNLVAPNLSALAASFGATEAGARDALAGQLAFALFAVGGPGACAIGMLTDRSWVARTHLLAAVLLTGSAGAALSSVAPTVPFLFWARALSGVALGGLPPLLWSLLADYAPASQRTRETSRVMLAASAGTVAGQTLAGVLGPTSGWRMPFAITGAALALAAGALLVCMWEPERGLSDLAERQQCARPPSVGRNGASANGGFEVGGKAKRNSDCGNIGGVADVGRLLPSATSAAVVNGSKRDACQVSAPPLKPGGSKVPEPAGPSSLLLRSPTVWLIVLQGVPGCLPWAVINTFLSDYLHADCGFSVHEAVVIASAFGLAGMAGQLAGGEAGQWLQNRVGRRAPAVFMWGSGSLRVLPCLALILAPAAAAAGYIPRLHTGVLACLAAMAGFLSALTGAPLGAALQNAVPARERGAAFALMSIFGDVGNGVGPIFLAIIAARVGRTRTFAWSLSGWLISSALCGLTAFTSPADEDKARAANYAAAAATAAAAGPRMLELHTSLLIPEAGTDDGVDEPASKQAAAGADDSASIGAVTEAPALA